MQKEKLINFDKAYKVLRGQFKSNSCYGCPKLSLVKFIKNNYKVETIDNNDFLSNKVFKNITKDLKRLYSRT